VFDPELLLDGEELDEELFLLAEELVLLLD
jgi:hypothetical protein